MYIIYVNILYNIESLRFPENHISRAVFFLRNIQNKIAQFSVDSNFNIQLGIGINQGVSNLGLLGKNNFGFYDLNGSARDLAVAMASFYNDGYYIYIKRLYIIYMYLFFY